MAAFLPEVDMHFPTPSRLLAFAVATVAFSVGALASPVAATFGPSPRQAPLRVARPAAAQTHPPTVPPRRKANRGWMLPGAGFQHPLLYVTHGSEVDVYDGRGRHPQQVGAITDGIQDSYGAYVDHRGTLYVVNWSGDPPDVAVYPAGSTSPSIEISDQLQRPLYATTDRHDHLFVSDANTGNVTEYKPGGTVAVRVLRTGGGEADGLAFNAAGDLYVAYRTDGHNGIEVFRGGKSPGQDLGIDLSDPQGLVFDPAGNLIVAETAGADKIDVFAPGQTSPLQTWHVRGVPTGLAFDLTSKALFTSCLASHDVRHLMYPDGRRPGPWLAAGDGLQGMAFSPLARH
jgi:hypothetical protein